MKVESLQLKKQEAESRNRRDSVPEHASKSAGVKADSPDDSSFERRLDELRSAIRGPSRSTPDKRVSTVSSRIRHMSWIVTAVVFLAVLFVRWNGQTAELAGSAFIAALIAAAVLCLAELIVLLVRRL